MSSDDPKIEAWNRLLQGKPLDGLPLSLKNGRIDLTCLNLPAPSVKRRFKFAEMDFIEHQSTISIEGAKWCNIDFTGSRLDHLRFLHAEIDNCVFDKCQCFDWRIWATAVSSCSFKAADLGRAMLGGVLDGKRCLFENVQFDRADLRRTVYVASVFRDCSFRSTKLAKIDFQSTCFEDCIFEGLLDEVVFRRHGYGDKSFPPNEMVNVDFSRARFHYVEFRGLELDKVRLPLDGPVLLIDDYATTLDRILVGFAGGEDSVSRRIRAHLGYSRKWAAPGQRRGVINLADIEEIGGQEAVDRVLDLYGRRDT